MLTSTQVDSISAVYETLPAGLGLQLGMVRQIPNTNKFCQLVQAYASASVSLSVGAMLYLENGNANSPVVDMTQSATSPLFAVNDNAAAAVPAGYYFWATISGPCTVTTSTGDATNTFEVPSATAGQGANASAYSVHQANRLLLLAANSSGAAANRAAILFGGL